jgi:hypothetical protein
MKLSKELYDHMKQFSISELFVNEKGEWFGGAVETALFKQKDGSYAKEQDKENSLTEEKVWVANSDIVSKVTFKEVSDFVANKDKK